MSETTTSSPPPQVLLTGFEPFLTHARNPSEEVAHFTAQELERLGITALAMTLPVTYACAEDFLTSHIVSQQQLLIHIGLADRRTHISLEKRAFNRHGDTLDNLSVTPAPEHGGKLASHEDAPGEIVSALDIDALEEELSSIIGGEEHIEGDALPKVHITQDAGDYVCNAIYYHSLQKHPRALFIHVPPLPEEKCRRLGKALAQAIRTTLLTP